MVEQAKVLQALKKLREGPKRNFVQTIELIVNLKDIDLKKEEAKIEEFIELPANRAKESKVCALVGPELKEQASKLCNTVVLADDFGKFDKRAIKKLVKQHDYFIAQANVMPAVAKTFGRYLSSSGKMPSPKAGHIVPPKANLEPLVKKLKKTVKARIKKTPVIQLAIGSEKMEDKDLLKNFNAVLSVLKTKLPRGEHNIKDILLKTTMGGPVKVQ